MADVHTKKQRSKNMSAIRSKGNKSTELVILQLLRKNKITGWRRHIKKIQGTPDFTFKKEKIVVFVDGCFWHGCPKCKAIPKTNKKFWINKMNINKQNDRKTNKILKADGWTIIRFWEHQIKKGPANLIKRIKKELNK